MFFIGKVAGMMFLSQMGDSIGRIKLLRISQVATFICYFMITFVIKESQNLLLPIFITGLLSCWRTNLSYIYVQELFSSKFKKVAGTIFLVNDVMTMFYSTMFFQYVST